MPRITDERDICPIFDPILAVARGIVVGGEEYGRRYRFYTRDGQRITSDEQWFEDDAEAEKWFKERYPEHHGRGAEMRCYYD